MAFNFENFIVLSLIKISTQLLLALEFLIQLRDFSCNQNVNVARQARNVTWDFFCDFQTLCTQKEMVQKRVLSPSFQRKEELVTRQIGVFQVLELSGIQFPTTFDLCKSYHELH